MQQLLVFEELWHVELITELCLCSVLTVTSNQHSFNSRDTSYHLYNISSYIFSVLCVQEEICYPVPAEESPVNSSWNSVPRNDM